MSKDEIIELLKTYKEKQAKLGLKKLEKKRKLTQLKNLKEEEINTKITQNYTEGGKTNQVSSKTENSIVKREERIANLREEIEVLDKEIEVLEIDVEEVDIRLASLTFLEKEIITAYYIDKFSYAEIGNLVYYRIKQQTRTEESIKKMIERIVKKLKKL